MQNYHTPRGGPLTAILTALSTADPTHGMTALQIATATNLNLVDDVIPALRGFVRGDVIVGSPVQQREGMSFILNPATPLPASTPAEPVAKHDSMRGLMSTREEAQALAQRIRADGYEVMGLDSMPLIEDVWKPDELQRRMWHVHIWHGNNGRSFLSVAEYEAWRGLDEVYY